MPSFISIKDYIYIGLITIVAIAVWSFWDNASLKPKSELKACIATQAVMNDTILENKKEYEVKIFSVLNQLQKSRDDLNITYQDGYKQGKADAIYHKCINFDLWTS